MSPSLLSKVVQGIVLIINSTRRLSWEFVVKSNNNSLWANLSIEGIVCIYNWEVPRQAWLQMWLGQSPLTSRVPSSIALWALALPCCELALQGRSSGGYSFPRLCILRAFGYLTLDFFLFFVVCPPTRMKWWKSEQIPN